MTLKKITAALVATLMIATMGSAAFADAGIGFDGGDPVIIDPHNPGPDPDTNPNSPDPDANFDKSIATRSIDFGAQKLSTKTVEYDSMKSSRTEENKTIGILLANPDPESYWQIRVQTAGFFINGKQTMKGFTMTLKSQGPLYDNVNKQNPPTRVDSVVLTASDDGSAGAAQPVLTAGKIGDDYTTGQWGGNYSGVLKVLGNTAKKGDATAVITWEVITQTP